MLLLEADVNGVQIKWEIDDEHLGDYELKRKAEKFKEMLDILGNKEMEGGI